MTNKINNMFSSNKGIIISLVCVGMILPLFAFAWSPPGVRTDDATNITATSATLNGAITSTGGCNSIYARFQYGESTIYGQMTPRRSARTYVNFSQNVSNLSPCATYHFRITAYNNSGTSYGTDKTFTTECPAPTVDIKANASDGPITIEYDNSASLTWVSEHADSCSGSGAWSGDKTLLGSESTGNLTSSKTYTITCVNPGGTASDAVIVNVDNIPPPAPTVDIKANTSDGPITIDYEETAELTWTSTNAGSCFATGGWSGIKQIIGSERTGDLVYSETYIIMCTGVGGTATDSVTVNVNSPPDPTVDIKANGSDGPITIGYEESVELTWVSANAGSCYATGGWLGDKPLFGAETTGSLTYSKTYSINCTGPGGYAADSVTVQVGDKPNNPPVANAGPDKETYETESIVLQGSGTDPDGDDITYSWTCTGGSLSSSTIAQPLYYAPTVVLATTYACTLTVTDPYGLADSDSMSVLVQVHESPTLYVSFLANPNSGCAPLQNVNLSASVYGTATGPITYFFDCNNDGNWEKVITRNDSEYIAYNLCNYNNPGNYTAKVMIERDLLSVQATVPINAQNCAFGAPPSVDIKANGSNGPITIDYDDTANLSWTSSNANSCFASNAWSGSKSLNGSQTTDHLTEQKTYTITCSGSNGTATDSVTIKVSDEPEQGEMTVEKTARNLTDRSAWAASVSAEPNDIISFSIIVRAKDAKIYDIIVEDALPDRLVYQPGSLKISGIKSTGNIFTGLDIGNISANKKKTITYNAYTMGPSNFNYGQTLLKNSVVVTSDDSGITDSSSASIMISRIKTITTGTIGAIGTATGIATGITNNILLDSFFIPLIIALTLIYMFKSYVLDAQDWFELRKVKYQEFQAKKLLQLKIAKIRAREALRA